MTNEAFPLTYNMFTSIFMLFPSLVHVYLTLSHTIHTFDFENIVEKGENAGYQHFLLFPKCFQHHSKQKSLFQLILFCRLQMLSCVSWVFTSTRLRLRSVLLKDTLTKKTEDPVPCEPRVSRLQFTHFTTEPRRTPKTFKRA